MRFISNFKELSEFFEVEPKVLAAMVVDCKNYYREVKIPKRKGGLRKLCIPKEPLKTIQKKIKSSFLDCVDTYDCAHAYKRARSIVTNARKHLGADYIFKVDIKDFFPSINRNLVYSYFEDCVRRNEFKSGIGYTRDVAWYLTELCIYFDGLPQGGPSSPPLSNIVSKKLDSDIIKFCNSIGIAYTRYSDDLIFSSAYPINNPTRKKIIEIIEENKFSINFKKIAYIKPGRDKIVTGILLSEDKLRIPKARRRDIRSEYFKFKSAVRNNTFLTEADAIRTRDRLLGKFAYWLMVDPLDDYARRSLIELQSAY